MLRPPPQLTVSAWAEQHRILGSRASSEPGPWRTSRTPYLRDVMDALSAVHPARRIVVMKGAQVRSQLVRQRQASSTREPDARVVGAQDFWIILNPRRVKMSQKSFVTKLANSVP